MSWLKTGRWLLIGIVGLNGAAACGGRGDLPTGEATGDEFGGTVSTTGGSNATAGTFAFGGATSTGATGPIGGSVSGGATSIGGTLGVAGTRSVAGTAGIGGTGGGICVPGLSMCRGNGVATCNPAGTA